MACGKLVCERGGDREKGAGCGSVRSAARRTGMTLLRVNPPGVRVSWERKKQTGEMDWYHIKSEEGSYKHEAREEDQD